MPDLHVPVHPVRFVTSAALFDGHDAAINIMRRILQSQGAEVIHLGHNRAVHEVVDAVLTEDVQGVAVSSYQGGHVEYFEYLAAALREAGAGHVRIFGGGGGVIVAEEIARLAESGVRIFSPEDGQRLGLPGMINELIRDCDVDLSTAPAPVEAVLSGERKALARTITCLQQDTLPQADRDALAAAAAGRVAPVLGITGTGGSGKSSLTDELVRRLRSDQQDKLRVAILAADPTRRRGGGALLGDRIRMNSLDGDHIYFRSLATRGARELPTNIDAMILACRAAGYDLVILETPGIGQGDAAIVDHVDVSLYVMTPEFGAASQLEKIDMLDYADVVAINKFERRGAADALRDVSRQLVRNREAFGAAPEDMPVFGTSAATFNDDGVTALYQHLTARLGERGLALEPGVLPRVETRASTRFAQIIPPARVRYLAEIAETVRAYHAETAREIVAAQRVQRFEQVLDELPGNGEVADLLARARKELSPQSAALLADWPAVAESYRGEEQVVRVRDRELRTALRRVSLSGSSISRVALPRYTDHGELLRFLRAENLPGRFPFTAGVFAFKRDNEDPARMFAGEGDPFRTNRRFKVLSEHADAKRLSTAFDSVTLYGHDPAERPDIYGKVGTSGVSIATLDDMTALYDGFDLTAPTTSVSMTINGPAPTILAFFLNTAIDQALHRFSAAEGREPSPAEAAEIRATTLATVRGTVQADILKEDQGQNTCIFSTEFSLRMMSDIQEWFVRNGVRNFYSVSISGYHIAEAGANPISQLAFTLANGFTYVEAYLARGMRIDDFAPNLSFFFSNGMDPEYSVIGRVARRIWAITLRDKYGAGERAQKLKYHIQTSGRSLHAQEMSFNDIRTTLQALIAIYDNCNSLHTNAYDEAVTTPTEESVRRALAIQLIINKEWGLAMNENPLQGSFIIDELTDLVEEAVLAEFDRISERGGVLGAMETGYQRGRIQDESMLYEGRKHDGSLPIVGVNTFRNPHGEPHHVLELARATENEKQSQLDRTRAFRHRHRDEAHAALARLEAAARSDDNVFEVLMDAARVCTLQQITDTFFAVGGQYRRNV
ncbi:cobalamin-dependent protein [Nocardia terpenica]|uniref:fused isobutyryl-CoA mutase/GTPase IcmF n=1 Tax=Nocardia terpenica TaxID=455432 RepID=UPI00189492F6|nr:fused isobutyryl-CoA mutase/GTPase IcmF [Nocardia terpenica]MBF6061927.1 cobalamin-dependent protein [Nocardia terpenica]MBF6106272.1 cobalamin-dependent protein [Nocardia terpenica]MBF6110347.1 cobalamin-dependent protein [Nocardia terpenica]MBF6120816.1 cobalamin-dependent protein [Nocardia terpenica]MBF6151683.1 cobalamin-dependent protein [Nocardia terpenica]